MLATLTKSRPVLQFWSKRCQSTTTSFFKSLHQETDKPSQPFPSDKFAKVVSNAEKIVGYPTSFMSLRCLLSDEMNTVAMYIRKLVGTKHPLLKIARGLVFNGRYSAQTRGLVVLLISKAAAEDDDIGSEVISGIHNKQRQLAEIIETIHLADLIHKGIVNLADLDDAAESTAQMKDLEFGNKITVLTGDFLLANACTNLAKLENPKVVETVSNAISDMMESNFVFMDDGRIPSVEEWKEHAFLSRGSLLANCCSCALQLAGADEKLQKAAFDYGKYLTYTHQICDDIRLLMEGPGGSGSLNRYSLPVIHYLSQRKDDVSDDLKLQKLVKKSESIAFSLELCQTYGSRALETLSDFKSSSSRDALKDIVTALTSPS